MKNNIICSVLILGMISTAQASQVAVKRDLEKLLKTNPQTWQDADVAKMRDLISKYPKSGQAHYLLQLNEGLESKNRAKSTGTGTAGTGTSGRAVEIGGTTTAPVSGQGTSSAIRSPGTGYPTTPTAPQAPTAGGIMQPTVPTVPISTPSTKPATQAPTAPQAPIAQSTPEAPLAAEAPQAPEAPEAPLAPETPSAQKPSVTVKPIAKPMGLKPLTAQELQALSLEEKKASDRIFTETIIGLAKTFEAFEKFKNNIQITLKTLVEKNNQFKKRQELYNALESFDELIKTKITYSKDFNIKTALSGFTALLTPCVFDEKLFAENTATYVSLLLISIAASQRNIIDAPSKALTIASDGVVHDVLQTIVAAVKQDSGYQTFEKAATERSKVDEKKQAQENLVKATLNADYLMMLHEAINVLRLNPEFLQFVPPIKRIKEAQNAVAELQTRPLLLLLLSNDSSVLNPRIIHGTLSTQLFYSSDMLNEILPNDSLVLRAMIDDHIQRLKSFKKAPLAEFLNDRLVFAKTTKDVITALEEAKTRAELQGSNAKDIATVIATLKTYSPDSIVVKNMLTTFGVKAETVNVIIDNIVAKYTQEKATASKAAQILTAAKAEFAKTKKPVGAFIIKELEAQKLLGANRLQKIKGLSRTPEAVQQAFISLIGSMDEVNKLAKKEDFYKWIESYGTLFEILKSAQDKMKEISNNQEKLDLLIASLMVLNDAKILPNKPYAPAITTARGFIETGVFKGKLNTLIEQLRAYNIAQFNAELAAIALDASKLSEFTSFIQDIDTVLVAILYDLLKVDISKLNAGTADFTIPGLAITGDTNIVRRNAAVYKQWAGIFKDLIALLNTGINAIDLTAFDSLKKNIVTAAGEKLASSSIKYPSTPQEKEQKTAILQALTNYLDEVTTKLGYLKAAQAQKVEQKREQEQPDPSEPISGDGVPDAPPAP